MMSGADHRALAAGLAAILLLMATAELGAGAASVPCTRWHAVLPDDTCYSVARGAGLTVSLLRRLNKYLNCDMLHNWTRLCVRGVH